MAIVKRRLDICGREKLWEYLIESAGRRYRVTVRQLGRQEPVFACSCGAVAPQQDALFEDTGPICCTHIAEVQRDLCIARQAAAQMF